MLLFFLSGNAFSLWGFPFSFRKQELKTDYSQTFWDQIMQEQSLSDIRRGMGEMAAADYTSASNSFAKAVIKNTRNPLPYLLLGASLYWAGKVDNAISEYKEALSLDDKNPMAYQLLGIAYGWKGDVNLAQDYFLKANALDSNKADTHMNLGSTYAVQGNWEKALEHFRRSAELAPQEPLYHFQLATLYEAMGRDEQAEKSFKKALSLFSHYEDAQLSLAALYEKMGNTSHALKYYKKAVRTKPLDHVARLRLAVLYWKTGQFVQAREVMEKAFSIVAFRQDGLALNAVYRASGNSAAIFEEQIKKFKDSLSQVPFSKPVNIEVGLEYTPVAPPAQQKKEETSSFEKAYQTFRPAQGVVPSDSPMAFRRSFVLPVSDENQRQEQINSFIDGLLNTLSRSDGKYQVSLSLQGRTMDYASPYALNQNKTTAPKAVYDPRIVGNDMGLWVMGKTWLKHIAEAEEDLSENVSLQADTELFYLLSGLAALVRADTVSAKTSFLKAQEENPNSALALLGLGTTHITAGEDSSATAFYKQVLMLDKDNKTARKNLKVLEQE